MPKKLKKKFARLSTEVIPERYEIKIKPDLEKFVFEGEETVFLQIKKPTKTITLHSRELDIEVAEIIFNSKKYFAQKISYDEKAETATFHFVGPIRRGEAKLRLVFRGILNDKLRGFYRSQYEARGVIRHMATTQFESTDARRAFPCFDEPAQKAIFHVTLLVPTHTIAISNTLPISEEEREGNLREVVFSPTPKMSTYLLAFIIGEFEHVEKKTKEGTLVRVFTTPGKKHQAEFALECAVKTLSFYNDYFDIPYPLPVLDLIAIPDFSAGAMENWGAITYRETALLVDPKHSSSSSKQYVALVIAHEIAHQWFGNLVTMEWWTHLWLNEGFATYIEYLAVDNIFPKWNIWTQFAVNDLNRALSLDSLKHTHPIEVEVHHPDEIAEIFDEVSYSKGASVIRMLAEFLGEKDFRNGLRFYLKKHSYANASTIHLWQAFEKVSGKKIANFMKNWTGKSGYPTISVFEKAGKITLSQRRFFSNPSSGEELSDKTIWEVPIVISGKSGKVKKTLLNKKSANFSEVSKILGWKKINFGESGFFRTAYSPEILENLKQALRDGKLSEIDRLGLVRDAFALAEGGVYSTVDALALAEEYKGENSFSVWAELSIYLRKLDSLLEGTHISADFKKFAREIFDRAVKKVGFVKKTGESHEQALLRSLILSNAGNYGHEGTIIFAKKKMRDYLEKDEPVPADLRGAVYSISAEHAEYGNEKDFRKLLALYRKEKLHEEQGRIGRALASFKNKELLQETLDFAFSKSVRSQDALGVIASVWGNPLGRDLAWQFVKKNWSVFLERYGGGGYSLSRIVKAGNVFNTRAEYNDFKKFLKTHPAPGASRSVEQVLEKIDGNIRWLERDGEKIKKYLANGNLAES